MRTTRKYTRELLAPIVAESRSIAEVLRRLKTGWTGGAHDTIKRRIREYGLDTSHFYGQGSNRGSDHRGGPRKKRPEERLILRENDGKPEAAFRLRRAMIEAGMPYQCAECGNDGTWKGKPLALQIDHINGNKYDNRKENLRFLCPNCHSQTDTFGSKNIQRSAT